MSKLKSVGQYLPYLAAYMLAAQAYAYDLNGPSDGILGQITDKFQQLANFLTGPLAIGFVLISGALVFGLWVVAPQMGKALGFLLRAVAASVGFLNLGLFVTWAQGAAGN